MSEIWETTRSRRRENGQAAGGTIEYGGDGFDDSAAMESAVLAEVDTEFNGCSRTAVVTEPDPDRTGKWVTTVTYGKVAFATEDANAESFDTSGGTQRVLAALETINSGAPNGGAAPDTANLVGVTKTGVEGVDIVVPVFEFSITRLVPHGEMTTAYRKAIADATGTVNQAEFEGFATGEVLFMGASGQQRGRNQPWDVTFKFARKPNRTDVKLAEGTDYEIELGNVEGWHHVEVRTQEVVSAAAQALVHVPAAAYVRRMYEYSDFGELEID